MATRNVSAIADELTVVVESASGKLRLVNDTGASIKPAPNKWSKKEILGHLLDSASNNCRRFVRAPMVDSFAFPGYEQDEWVRRQDYSSKPWDELIDLWRLYNRHVAHVMRNIPPEKLETICTIGTGAP